MYLNRLKLIIQKSLVALFLNIRHMCAAASMSLTLYFKGGQITIGSRPSDHYFRSVCWFVCLFVQSFSQRSLIRFRSN